MKVTICPPGYAHGYEKPADLNALAADTKNVREVMIVRASMYNRAKIDESEKYLQAWALPY